IFLKPKFFYKIRLLSYIIMLKYIKNQRASMKTSKKLLSILLVVVFSFSCFFASFGATIVYAQTDVLQVHFLDVGQGDCSIIKLPDDKTILVDAGDNINKYKQKIIDYI